MAAFKNWYDDGNPYVHGRPKEKKGIDNFEPFFSMRGVENNLNKEYSAIIASLSAMQKRAQDFEKNFFSSLRWGVHSLQEFNSRFLAMPEFNLLNIERSISKDKHAESSLFQQIRWIINSPELHRILNSRDLDYYKTLNKGDHPFFTKAAYSIVESVIEANQNEFTINISEPIVRDLAKELVESGKLINVVKGTSRSALDLNSRIAKQAAQQYKAKSKAFKAKKTKEVRRLLRENIPILLTPIDEQIVDRAMLFIQNRLFSIPEVYFSNPNEQKTVNLEERKKNIIKDVLSLAEKFLRSKYNKEVRSGSVLEVNVTGDLGEFSIEIAAKAQEAAALTGELESALLSLSNIKTIGQETSWSPSGHYKTAVSLPIDIQIKQFIIQVKNNRTAILGGSSSAMPPSLKSKTGLPVLLDQISESGAISEDNLNKMMYNYVNFAMRGQADQVQEVAHLLVNWAVEFFIRSDTTRSLLQSVKKLDLPSANQMLGLSGASDRTPLNHFWIIGNKMFGVSNVISAAIAALKSNEKIESWYNGSPRITVPKQLNIQAFHREKLEIQGRFPDWSPNEGYGPEMLVHGKLKGWDIVSRSSLTGITANVKTLEQILGSFSL